MSAEAGLSFFLGCALCLPAQSGPQAAAVETVYLRSPVTDTELSIKPTVLAAETQKKPEGSSPPPPPGSGLALFLQNGCGACHAIKGTEARGTIGPDLSHVGSRRTIGAGTLPNTEETIARFIARPDLLKPGVKMPAFDMLPRAEIQAIATYLKGLQ